MKLEDIGFYTLADARAAQTSVSSPLWRCELILTDKCNFKCPYCRGLRKDMAGTLEFSEAERVCKYWISEGLRNIRFSGGEPTLYSRLTELVALCADNGVRVAISSNGSADTSLYEKLLNAGVTDFSISLDACCASKGDEMAGGIYGAWKRVVENIRWIAQRSYLTVGMVFNESNLESAAESILFADSLGVSDIRIVPSAQFNQALVSLQTLPTEVLNKYPILRYRIQNVRNGRNVRKMQATDSHKCRLALDDMAVANGYHFPCIIYMREGGDPIGKVNENTRKDREAWVNSHNCYEDPICKEMCLDVCIDYNNKAELLQQ